jgi:hypothetical protein
VVTAFLSESINAVACGSAQTFVDEEGEDEGEVVDVSAGIAVKSLAAGVELANGTAVSFGLNSTVEVTKISGVGVGITGVAEAHAVTKIANNAIAIKRVESFFGFILLSSFVIIVPLL